MRNAALPIYFSNSYLPIARAQERGGVRGREGRRDGGTEGEFFLTLHRFYSLRRRRITLKEERLERSGRTSSGSAGKYDACERGRVTALSHQIGMLRC